MSISTSTPLTTLGWEKYFDSVPHYKSVCENPSILRLPVGSVSNTLDGIRLANKFYYPEIGYILPQHIDEFKDAIQSFLDNGFTLRLGVELNERHWAVGMATELYKFSNKPIIKAILPTMQKVWLEIDDIAKAATLLETNKAVPCAVVCDSMDYSSDIKLKTLVDKANEYFIYFLLYGEPYSNRTRDEDYARMLLQDV